MIGRTPTVFNVTLTNADTEYSQTLPANVRSFSMQARQSADVRWAHETGKVATPVAPYVTMKSGGNVSVGELDPALLTLYLASATAGTVVEIVVWTW